MLIAEQGKLDAVSRLLDILSQDLEAKNLTTQRETVLVRVTDVRVSLLIFVFRT